MSTEEQTPGSIPHTFGNLLAWKWVPAMPAALKRAHVHTLLYAMRSMANASGELRFHGDRKPMRIRDIARAAGCDEKDARDRLEAVLRAGVVSVRGQRRRGVATLYVIFPDPRPDWAAAVAYLEGARALREEARQRREAERRAAPWDEKNGGRSPELDTEKDGGPPPELTGGTAEEVRGTAPRLSSGDRPPNGSGDRPPNNPGITQDSSQEIAEVVFRPQVVGGSQDHQEPQEPDSDPDDFNTWPRCPGCGLRVMPDPRRPGRTVHARCENAATHRGRRPA